MKTVLILTVVAIASYAACARAETVEYKLPFEVGCRDTNVVIAEKGLLDVGVPVAPKETGKKRYRVAVFKLGQVPVTATLVLSPNCESAFELLESPHDDRRIPFSLYGNVLDLTKLDAGLIRIQTNIKWGFHYSTYITLRNSRDYNESVDFYILNRRDEEIMEVRGKPWPFQIIDRTGLSMGSDGIGFEPTLLLYPRLKEERHGASLIPGIGIAPGVLSDYTRYLEGELALHFTTTTTSGWELPVGIVYTFGAGRVFASDTTRGASPGNHIGTQVTHSITGILGFFPTPTLYYRQKQFPDGDRVSEWGLMLKVPIIAIVDKSALFF